MKTWTLSLLSVVAVSFLLVADLATLSVNEVRIPATLLASVAVGALVWNDWATRRRGDQSMIRRTTPITRDHGVIAA